MPKIKALIESTGEVRELTGADIKRFGPAKDVLPAALQARLKFRGFQKEPIKERITIRLSPEVVKQFRNTGDGWQTRVDAALKDWLKGNAPARL